MENILISVCVSVYNDGTFLSRCLDSVISQGIGSIELVLVDDGSTDNTLQIMREYSKQFPFVKVIHQENMGLAQGRLTGVRNSIGEYVTFLDADDYLLDGAYKLILEFIKNNKADIYEFQTIREGYFSKSPYTGVLDSKKVLCDYFNGARIPVNYWLRWYRRELLDESIFPKGVSVHEDIYGFPCILNNAESIAYLNMPILVHTNREFSIMNTLCAQMNSSDYLEKQKSLLLSIPHIEKCIGKEELHNKYFTPFNHYITRIIKNYIFIDARGVSYKRKLKIVIDTLGLTMSPSELEEYIEKNTCGNDKTNYAIKKYGLHKAYILKQILFRLRIKRHTLNREDDHG